MEINNKSPIHLKESAIPDDKKKENQALYRACQDFEAILLNKMMTTMRNSIPDDGLFKKSFGEKIYQSMLDEELSNKMVQGPGIGFGDLLFHQLITKGEHQE